MIEELLCIVFITFILIFLCVVVSDKKINKEIPQNKKINNRLFCIELILVICYILAHMSILYLTSNVCN